MKELASPQPKQPRKKRVIPTEEKLRAVLEIWTECRSISSLCQELSVTRNQLIRWQEIAMAAMRQALEQNNRRVKKATLNQRLEHLLSNSNSQKKKPKKDQQQDA